MYAYHNQFTGQQLDNYTSQSSVSEFPNNSDQFPQSEKTIVGESVEQAAESAWYHQFQNGVNDPTFDTGFKNGAHWQSTQPNPAVALIEAEIKVMQEANVSNTDTAAMCNQWAIFKLKALLNKLNN